jgi:hypothetical protein
MVRGFEIILKGRDPRDAWAFAERACGVCTTVHALASVRTVEDALEITVPPNAELIRNLMFCAQYMQDHVVHFYHLHALDWVDVVSALKADPRKTSEIAQSISNRPRDSPKYFAMSKSASPLLSAAANWAYSRRATRDTQLTSYLPRSISWGPLITWRLWNGKRRSSKSIRSSEGKILIPISWLADHRVRFIWTMPMPLTRSGLPTWVPCLTRLKSLLKRSTCPT